MTKSSNTYFPIMVVYKKDLEVWIHCLPYDMRSNDVYKVLNLEVSMPNERRSFFVGRMTIDEYNNVGRKE